MECRLYVLSILTFIAFKNVYVTAEPSKRDSELDEVPSIDRDVQFGRPGYLNPYNAFSDDTDEIDDFEKRRSLMRFGKRRSLMRFGKRGSIMRFGKRPSLIRFGKRSFDDDEDEFLPLGLYDDGLGAEDFGQFANDKRGSIMRFGKKSSLLRFGRSADGANGPHTPWRFGRRLK